MSESKTKPIIATTAGVLSLAAVGGLSFLGFNFAGIPVLPKAPEVVAAAPTVVDTRTVVAPKDSPAVRTINKLMEGTKSLQAAGQIKEGGTPSLPFSCPAGSLGTSYSAARTFVHGGERIQIVASAYAAGYGPVAFDAMRQSVRNCASGVGTVSIWSENVGSSTGIVVDFKQSAGTTRFMMVKYGDNILHLQGSPKKLRSAAAAAIDVLASTKTCENPEQGGNAFARNPLAGTDFTGLYVKEQVTVDKPELPEVPEDEDFEPLTEDDKLPEQPAAITPAAQPSYPVYPSMPKQVTYPERPQEPAMPVLQSTVMVKAEDTAGPGCGWEYTGSPGAVWDATKARDENSQTVDEETAKLDEGVEQWSQLTLEYWKDAKQYAVNVAKYLSYSAQVSKVNEAWAKIAGEWGSYENDLNLWKEQENRIEQFLQDQAAATRRYEDDLQQCKDDAAKPAESPSPSADPEADPEDEDTEQPEQPEQPAAEPAQPVDCSIQVPRPAILDEATPESLEKPAKPADPRPSE